MFILKEIILNPSTKATQNLGT